ncbi:MAG TPA: hypothetical protein VF294_18320, partial [Polyangiaceae bacterium]
MPPLPDAEPADPPLPAEPALLPPPLRLFRRWRLSLNLTPARQLIVKLFDTVTAAPLKGGTCALWKPEATQPPVGVPAKAPLTVAVVTRPLGANVTVALPLPVGPPGFLHTAADMDAAVSAEIAADLLNGGASDAPGGIGSSFFFGASVVGVLLATATATDAAAAV